MSANINISRILRFSAYAQKTDLCRISADIYQKIFESSRAKKRLIIKEIILSKEIHPRSVSLKIRNDEDTFKVSQKQSLKELINDVVIILNAEGAFRFLKYFLRITFVYRDKFQLKTESEYAINARAIAGLFFRGEIFPAYAVWLITSNNEMENYVLPADILGKKAPLMKDRHEYFLRDKISKKLLYEDYLKTRRKNNKKYYETELRLRRTATKETLHELYFMAKTINPKLDIKNIEYFRNTPEGILFRSPQEYSMNEYIAKGEEGTVYRACCGNDCEYIIKIVNKDPADFAFRESCEREKMLWEEFMKIGLAPRLIETYIEDSYPFYCIFVSEAMDTSCENILVKILKKKDWKLLERFYRLIFGIIEKSHKNNLFHADSHLDNFMLKAKDKKIYNDLDRLLNELENGEVMMTYIDFGDSVSYDLPKKEILRTLEMSGVIHRLIDLGCSTSSNKLFKAIMYYDYYMAGQEMLFEEDNKVKEVRNIKKLFLNKMDSLKTECQLIEFNE